MPALSPEGADPFTPLGNFNFHVHFARHADGQSDGGDFAPMGGIATAITGAFSDISGLEASMEPKSLKVGGRNYGAVQLPGPVTFSTVVMKRGIILQRHLWSWWSSFAGADGKTNGGWGSANRCDLFVVLLQNLVPMVGWKLANAMPVKFRIGDLNAKGGEIAVEELHVVHEGLHMANMS